MVRPSENSRSPGRETDSRAIVFLVEDDAAVRMGLKRLLESQTVVVIDFPSAEAFLAEADLAAGSAHCLVLDICLPGMDGVSLQQTLRQRGDQIPTIVQTGYADVKRAVRLIKAGAFDVIQKPVHGDELSAAVTKALDDNRALRKVTAERQDLLLRLGTLTEREREIMDGLAAGSPVKELSATFGIGTQTILKHRARVLKKIGVRNEVQLVALLAAHGIAPSRAPRTALANASLEKGLDKKTSGLGPSGSSERS